MTVGPEPNLALLGGQSVERLLKRYLVATRPAFLVASLAPVLVGTTAGARGSGEMDWLAAALAALATLLVHSAANVLNDVADDQSGADRSNTGRIYPYTGGSRLIQNEVLSSAQMQRWGGLLLLAAAGVGIALFALKGPWVLAMGVAGISLGALYSLPPVKLVSRGWGESTIALAFGVLPFCGAACLQGGRFDNDLLLLSAPIACWVTAILLVNAVPDIAADRAAGKFTLPVRVGVANTRRLYVLLHVVAATTILAGIAWQLLHPLAALAALLSLMAGSNAGSNIIANDRTADKTSDTSRERLKAAIESTLRIHAIGSAILLVAIWLAPTVIGSR